MYAEIKSIWILQALQVSHPDSWAHIQVPHLRSVYVCVRIHKHTHTYAPTRIKNREDTDNTTIFRKILGVENPWMPHNKENPRTIPFCQSHGPSARGPM